jgi:hypothetical protein
MPFVIFENWNMKDLEAQRVCVKFRLMLTTIVAVGGEVVAATRKSPSESINVKL